MNNIISIDCIEKQHYYKKDILYLYDYPKQYNNFLKTRTNFVFNLSKFNSKDFKVFIKDYIEENIFKSKTKPNIVVKNKIRPLCLLLEFLMEYYPNIEKINDLNKEKEYEKWLIKNKNITTIYKEKEKTIDINKKFGVYRTLCLYERKYNDKNKDVFEKDIWSCDNFNLSPSRYNLEKTNQNITFYEIENTNNKDILKKYTKHLLFFTSNSIQTITKKIETLTTFLKYLDTINIQDVNENIVNEYLKTLEATVQNVSYNIHISRIDEFIDFLISKKIIEKRWFIREMIIKNSPRKYHLNIVDDYVINQIFKILPNIDNKLALMFLINYATGFRISDICSLKIDSLIAKTINKNNENIEQYFIKKYCNKMNEYDETPIPKSLSLLIKNRIEEIKKFDYEEIYLFNSETKRNKPYVVDTFLKKFNKELNKIPILNEDGTPYIYRSHYYRHTIAEDMIEANVPFEVIRKMLHHKSPEMTLYYTEIQKNKQIDLQKTYINNQGEMSYFSTSVEMNDTLEIDWLKKNINAQVLPNGFCGMPTKLGECPSGNSCLECEKFRTTKDFLEVHKQQLSLTNKILENAQKNNWQIQIATNTKIKNSLEKIIETIEKEC